MSKYRFTGSVLPVALALVFASGAPAADEKKPLMTGASPSMLANTCAGCHGTLGASNGPSIPTIAGLSPDYFTSIMEAYKSGDTYSTIMGRIAAGYTEQEIETLAKFFSKQKFSAAAQKFDASLAKKGAKLHDKYCEKCHSEGGTLPDDDAGLLAGQWKPYLSSQVADAMSGQRAVEKKMLKKLKQLHEKEGDDGVNALLHYYGSQQ